MTENEAKENFRDYVNEMTPPITILGVGFTPSRIMEELDPIHFDQEFTNYVCDILDIDYDELEAS